MREETAEEYLQIFKRVVEAMTENFSLVTEAIGATTEEQKAAVKTGMSLVPDMAVRSKDGQTVPLKMGIGEPDWEKLKAIFLAAEEPTPEQRLAAIERMGSIHHILRRAFRDIAKKIPHAPGGHPFALDTTERLDACKRIEVYRTQHYMDTAEAVARVARELKSRISEKTLRRYYDRHVKLLTATPTTKSRASKQS